MTPLARTAVMLVAAVGLSLTAVCGCGEDSSSSGADTAEVAQQGEAQGGVGDRSGIRAEAEREEAATRDQSVQGFGVEADEAERSEITAAMRAFVEAVGAGASAAACEAINSSLRAQAESLAPAGEGGCGASLAKLLGKREPERARRAAQGVVTRVRVEGDRALVIFKPRGEPISYLPLIREEDGWKVASLALGIPLVP